MSCWCFCQRNLRLDPRGIFICLWTACGQRRKAAATPRDGGPTIRWWKKHRFEIGKNPGNSINNKEILRSEEFLALCHFVILRFASENDVGRTLAEGYLQHRLVHQIVRYYEMQWHAFHWQERENEHPARYGVGSPRVSMHRVKDTHKVHKDLQRANQITTSHKLSLGRMHTCWFSWATYKDVHVLTMFIW